MQTSGPLLFPDDKDLEKIIEMAKKLYPEIQKGYEKSKFFFNKLSYNVYIIEDSGQNIVHWYEFLIRWIIPKIDIPYSSHWKSMVIDCKDPIQPVYDEFKRRKL